VFAGVVDGLEDVRRHGFFVERPTERGWLMAADDLPIAVKRRASKASARNATSLLTTDARSTRSSNSCGWSKIAK
jgi:hypothetical protein